MATGSGRMLPSAVLCLLVLLVAAVPLDVLGQAPAGAQAVAITNVTVIDASGAAAQPDMTVVVRGDRIATVGASRQVPVPRDATVVDGAGKFLIPGLWDMHVHTHDQSWLTLFLANGVTGVRVMKGEPVHHGWRQGIAGGELLGPRMVIGSNLIDGPDPIWAGSVAVSDEADARRAVQQAKEKGADFVKVYSLLPRPAFFALADEARKQDIVFAGHVPDAVTAAEVSDAGQRSIEHLSGITMATSTRETEIRAEIGRIFRGADYSTQRKSLELAAAQSHSLERAQSLFDRFARNGTWQVSTLAILRSLSRMGDVRYGQDERLRYIAPDLAQSWQRYPQASRSPQQLADQQELFHHQLALVGAMNRAGVGLLAGTDALNPFCFPGFSLHDELELFVQAGLLGADPLADIRNTRQIDGVVTAGVFLPRDRLDAMLAEVEAVTAARSSPAQRPRAG
ncbi:MAG: amidohydrolase family protein [Pseudonocardiaceae bacterium]